MPIVSVPTSSVIQLKNWSAGINETNGEGFIQLDFHGGISAVTVQLSHWQAQELSAALAQIAKQTAPGNPN